MTRDAVLASEMHALKCFDCRDKRGSSLCSYADGCALTLSDASSCDEAAVLCSPSNSPSPSLSKSPSNSPSPSYSPSPPSRNFGPFGGGPFGDGGPFGGGGGCPPFICGGRRRLAEFLADIF